MMLNLGEVGRITAICYVYVVVPPPLTSTWPHLRCDVGLEEGEY